MNKHIRDEQQRWSRREDAILHDSENAPFNVSIPKSLKREIELEKVRSGKTFKELSVQAWTDYLRRQHTEPGE